MKRREVISKIAMTTGALVVLPSAFISCEKNDPDPDPDKNPDGNDLTIDLSKAENATLLNDGGFLISGNIIVINSGGENYIALSKICTHNGCSVTYNEGNNNLPCPCHGSVFAVNGSVITGPATTSLKTYSVRKDGVILTIS